MPSVFERPQSSAQVVAARSRPLAAAFALLLALAAWPVDAHAEAPGTADALLEPPAAPLPREQSYRGLLATSYVLAPFLALGVGHLLSELEADDTVAVLGAGTMFFAPAAVHMAYGNVGHGPLAFLGLAGSTAAGTLLGGAVGYGLSSIGCDPAEDSEGCDFAGFGGLVVGGLLGGIGGYTGFALYDVSVNGAVARKRAPRDGHASLQLWLSPLPAAKTERAAGAPFGGLAIGAILEL
jgi:hypothetical protein